eukprot:6647492-Alexandrium_andersonii.AAC.1
MPHSGQPVRGCDRATGFVTSPRQSGPTGEWRWPSSPVILLASGQPGIGGARGCGLCHEPTVGKCSS